MKKHVIGVILTAMMLAGLYAPTSAQEAPRILLDGRALAFDVPPTIENDRVLVPMGAIFQAMGAIVTWDADTSTVTAVKDDVTVILTIGSVSATINGDVKTLDVPAQVINGRTLVQLSFIGQAFGGSVSWDPETWTVSIVSGLPNPIEYEIYSNTEIEYSMPYPEIYDAVMDSDAGDGVSMETGDGLYRLKIWGEYNINKSTGQDLQKEALKRVSGITSQYADDNSYSIEYVDDVKGQKLIFSENAWVAGDKIIGFVISYPNQEKDQFDVIIGRMAAGVKNDDPTLQDYPTVPDYNHYDPLINALCLSESLHYDPFTIEPDNITTTYTIFDLVSNKYFPGSDELQPVDGAYFFSSGPETEGGEQPGDVYISPDYLYQAFFASGGYKYPPVDLSYLIEGTQTGIEVHSGSLPASVSYVVKNIKNEKDITRMTVTIYRTDSYSAELLGDAEITLQNDKWSSDGYQIIAYKPLYAKFDDIKLQK